MLVSSYFASFTNELLVVLFVRVRALVYLLPLFSTHQNILLLGTEALLRL